MGIEVSELGADATRRRSAASVVPVARRESGKLNRGGGVSSILAREQRKLTSQLSVARLRRGLRNRIRKAYRVLFHAPPTTKDRAKIPYAVQRARQYYPMLSADEVAGRLAYSTFVNFERRYMYFEVPKAGCTSIKMFLHRLEGLPPPKQPGRFEFPLRREATFHDRRLFPMGSVLDHTDAEQEFILESPDFFRFALVRNPYTRLISAWKDKVQRCQPQFVYLYEQLRGKPPEGIDEVISFEEFIGFLEKEELDRTDGHWRRQTAHLFIPAMNFSCIGKIEQMADTMRRFGQHLGQDIGLPDRSHPSFGSVGYDQDVRERVYQLYKPDFINFGYDKESWRSSDKSQPNMVPVENYLQEILSAHAQIVKLDRIRRELLAMAKLT